jgi:hypothetical protein
MIDEEDGLSGLYKYYSLQGLPDLMTSKVEDGKHDDMVHF